METRALNKYKSEIIDDHVTGSHHELRPGPGAIVIIKIAWLAT